MFSPIPLGNALRLFARFVANCDAPMMPDSNLKDLISAFPCPTSFSSSYLWEQTHRVRALALYVAQPHRAMYGRGAWQVALHTGEARTWHGRRSTLGKRLNANTQPVLLQLVPQIYQVGRGCNCGLFCAATVTAALPQDRFLTQANVRTMRSASISSLSIYRFSW